MKESEEKIAAKTKGKQSKRPFAKSDFEINAERRKLELDITQEFEFADGEATLLIDETK